jgi:hypothetical protein
MGINPERLSEYESQVRAAYELQARFDALVSEIASLQQQLQAKAEQQKFWQRQLSDMWSAAYDTLNQINESIQAEVLS